MGILFDKFKTKLTGGEEPKKCNHDPNDPNNTLKMSARKNMVTPNICGFVCPNCGTVLRFKKTENGYEKM